LFSRLPEKTAQSFVKHPFRNDEMLYRTGDLVRLTSDFEIIIVGRRDTQVKLNGQRIEITEIEDTLLKNELVNQVNSNPLGTVHITGHC
jgi:non-ribosomal peptide synthetase component F